jgi:hypothetical protein
LEKKIKEEKFYKFTKKILRIILPPREEERGAKGGERLALPRRDRGWKPP